MRPPAADVRTTFLRHYTYSLEQSGETFLRDLNKENSTTLSYAGRTVFELLQNALDLAERRVVVALTPGPEPLLLVGNDGPGVRVDPNFNYDPPDFTSARERSDFHALCSINTSNKSAARSIGNKGVGFRSVFSLGKRVQVWSRLAEPEGGCWGLEMLSGWTRDAAERRRYEEPAVEEGWKWLGDDQLPEPTDQRPRPSFYFPLPLRAKGLPATLPGVDALETVVLVPLSGEAAIREARQTLEELTKTHLYFVGLREGKESVEVTVHSETGTSHHIPLNFSGADEHVGLVASWRVREKEPHNLVKQAMLASHELPRPGVAVAWPKESRDGARPPRPPLVYGYLPTRIDSPLGVDIHADFRLDENRTAINSDRMDPVGGYNAALLEAAAELHLVMALRAFGLDDTAIEQFPWSDGKKPGFCHIGAVSQCTQGPTGAMRSDLFWLLRPLVPAEKAHPLISHLERMLFGDAYEWDDTRCYRRWAELAARFFGTEPGPGVARRAYDLFWQATGKWLERAVINKPTQFGHRHHYAERCVGALVQALRDSRARVVPLVTDGPTAAEEVVGRAFPAPDRREERDGGGRLQYRLFFRPSEEAQGHPLDLPQAVLERGRAVTSYPLGADLAGMSPKIFGAAEFSRWEILADLRQLPSALGLWTPATFLSPEKHLDVLAFVAQLYAIRLRGNESPQESRAHYGWGWRGDLKHTSDTSGRAGRALATLFLRTTEGMYEPARQLSADRVERTWLAPLAERVPGLDLDGFLYFLGVSPISDLLLVEDGQKGVVAACAAPPTLTDADGPSGKLELVVRAPTEALAERLTRAWPELEPIVQAENEGRLKLGFRATLSKLAFVSCKTPGFHTPYQVLSEPAPPPLCQRSCRPDREAGVSTQGARRAEEPCRTRRSSRSRWSVGCWGPKG